MPKFLFLIFIFLFTFFLLGQSAFSQCDHIFTTVQHPPSLKISNDNFQDTLAEALKSRKFPFKNNEIIYDFVVTKESAIEDLVIVSGHVPKEKQLRAAFLDFAGLWVPATQHGFQVCASVRLKLKFSDNNVRIEII